MKCFWKVFCIVAGALAAAKLIQLLVDFLYENYGKRYITTDTVE